LAVARADAAHHGPIQNKESRMKSKRIVCMLTAAAMGLGSLSAFAQGHDERRDHDRGDHRYEQGTMGNRGHDEDRHERRDARDGRYGHDRRDEGRYDHDRRGDHDVYYYGARGPEWHRGGRLPSQYRDHQYVVDNWHEHHLAPPPRGYHWVQVGNDYVLAAIATGIIAQLLLNNGY
jgi:Ni/Co efflux regulator RcnB